MKDIIDSVRAQIGDRLNSPLFGAFAISWFAWNHRLVFTLFSGLPIQDRFDFIDRVLYPEPWSICLNGVALPAVTAILFIYFFPVCSKVFYGYWLKKQLELKAQRDEIENSKLLTLEESRAIRMAMFKTRDEYEDRIKEQADEIDLLKKREATELARSKSIGSEVETELKQRVSQQTLEIADLRRQVATREKADSKIRVHDLDAPILNMIVAITNRGGFLPYDELQKAVSLNEVRMDYFMEKASELGLVQIKESGVTLTSNGRAFVVQNDLDTIHRPIVGDGRK